MSEATARPPRMADVAAVAGVSRQLVGIVFRNEYGASKETRERVLAAAREIGYRPNVAARMLAKPTNRQIGVLYTMQHAFDVDLVEALFPVAAERGYTLALGGMTRNHSWRAVVDELIGLRSQALLVIGPDDDLQDELGNGFAVPVISIGRAFENISSVHMDDAAASRLAVQHLAGLGHTSIAHIGGGAAPGAARRESGYVAAMKGLGLESQIRVLPGNYTEEAGAAAADQLLAEGLPCTAVLAANDRCAVGLMVSLLKAGIRIPEDMSIVGVDDSRLAQMSHVALTSVKQDVPRIAREALSMAQSALEQGPTAPPMEVVIETALVVRDSTAAPSRVVA